jgi:hypothetical protein
MRPRGERGALELVYNRETGKPLTVPLDTTMDQLRRCVDPGRYRLDPVAENGQQPDDAPAAYVEVIRPRQTATAYDGEDGSSDDGWSDGPTSRPGRSDPNTEREAMRLTVRLAESVIKSASSATSSCVASPPVPTLGLHDLVAELVRANTRMAELVIQGVPSMLTAASGLITAADGANLPTRQPLPPPPEPEREPEWESVEAEEGTKEAAPAFGIPEVVRLLIKETIDKVVSRIFSGAGLGGLPLEALLDWRKAAPSPAAAPSAPAASTASSTPMPPSPASWPASAAASYDTTLPPSPSAPAPADAAPSRESPPEATPADPPTPPVASSPRSQEDAAAMINAHVLQVWQGLSPPERARAGQLIALLTPEERTAWLAELTRLTVPEAITRARAIIHAQIPPTPTTTQLPTATPQGDPS